MCSSLLVVNTNICTRQQFPSMNLFWTDEFHTPMNDTRSRDVTRKRRHR